METHGLRSAILVTSPYHLHRASLTFEGVFREAGIRVIGRPAPDGAWRKISWWTRPTLASSPCASWRNSIHRHHGRFN